MPKQISQICWNCHGNSRWGQNVSGKQASENFGLLCLFSLRPGDCFKREEVKKMFPFLHCHPLHLPQDGNTSWLGYPCLDVPSSKGKGIVLHSYYLSYQMWRYPESHGTHEFVSTLTITLGCLEPWRKGGWLMSSDVPNKKWHRWTQKKTRTQLSFKLHRLTWNKNPSCVEGTSAHRQALEKSVMLITQDCFLNAGNEYWFSIQKAEGGCC